MALSLALILRRDFLKSVGVPRIAYFDDPDWMKAKDRDGPNRQTAFIQIPHIHPGRDKYGGQPESLRRTFIFTWMATLVINCYMMEAIDKLGNSDELSRREELCRVVVNRFEKEAAALIKEFEKVKNQLSKDSGEPQREENSSEFGNPFRCFQTTRSSKETVNTC